MALPTQFFTPESMLTLTGAAGATFVICNGLQKALDFNPKWLALAVALVLTSAGMINSHGDPRTPIHAIDGLVAIVNGFLVYATATGTNQIAGRAKRRADAKKGLTKQLAPTKRGFWETWF
jgi:hypothetical protein